MYDLNSFYSFPLTIYVNGKVAIHSIALQTVILKMWNFSKFPVSLNYFKQQVIF